MDKLGYREWTALVEAAMEGHEGCVRLLLHCGAGKKVFKELHAMLFCPRCGLCKGTAVNAFEQLY